MNRIKPALKSKKPSVRQNPSIHHPAHYQGPVECIDAIESALGAEGFLAYARGNVIKYAFRAGKKATVAEDMAKAAWYATRAAEVAEREGLE